MRRRVWIYTLSLMMALIIGIVGGMSYSNDQNQKAQLAHFENYPLSAFVGTLVDAHQDMKESTASPNTPLERAYQDKLKVDLGQSWVLWETMQPELIAQGLPSTKVQQIDLALGNVYNNILPPGISDQPASVKRAMAWISTFYSCLYPDNGNGPVPSNATLLSRLKSNISVITSKYESYKSDGNFAVQSIFP